MTSRYNSNIVSDSDATQRKRVRPSTPSPPGSPEPGKLPSVVKPVSKPVSKPVKNPLTNRLKKKAKKRSDPMDTVTEEEEVMEEVDSPVITQEAGPVVVQARLLTEEEADDYRKRGGHIISVPMPEEDQYMGDTLVCTESRPCTPVPAVPEEEATQVLEPAVKPAPAPVIKGLCIVCHEEVTSFDDRHHTKEGYLHQRCKAAPVPVIKGLCILCQAEVTSAHPRHRAKAGYLHEWCDPVKGMCAACGKEVKQYGHLRRRVDTATGQHYHSECAPGSAKAD